MKYYDFDLWIDDKPPGNGAAYKTRVVSKMGDVTDGTLALDLKAAVLTTQLAQLDQGTADGAICKSIGELLFNSLFQGRVGRMFQASLGQVRDKEKTGLRIRLRVQPPEMAILPWELLYDKDEDCFLATSVETPLVRYIELPTLIRDLTVPLPVKVLLVIPYSRDLDTKGEEKAILKSFFDLNEIALQQLGRPAITYKPLTGPVTVDTINAELNRAEYHVFHFIGHGSYHAGQGHLQLTPRKGEDGLITGENFAYFFMNNSGIRLVLLNACKSATASATKLLTGVAQQLVKRSVPAVVAMQYSITDNAAKLFADDFYQNLCIGMEAGRVDGAVSHARKWVLQNVGYTSDFVAPVLHMRSSNGIIFDMLDQAATSSPIDQVHKLRDFEDTHHANKALLATKHAEATTPESKKILAAEISAEDEALSRIRRRVTSVYTKAAASALPQFLTVIFVVSIITFLAYYTKFFNILHLDDLWQRTFIAHMVGYVPNPMNDQVRVILIKDDDNQGLGRFTRSSAGAWRNRHAELIDGLVAAQARVVAFDLIFFDKTTSEANQALCKAITTANTSGKTQVLAGQRVEGGKFTAEGEITPELRECFKDNWANTRVGVERWALVDQYQLAQTTGEGNLGGDTTTPLIPSFALQAVAKYDRATPFYNQRSAEIQYPSAKNLRQIPIIPEGHKLNLIIGYADDQDIELVTRDYSNTYHGLKSKDPATLRDFEGRIVLVGAGQDDLRKVLGGSQPRYGVHIHANVISNILNNFFVFPLSMFKSFLIMGLMAILGFLLQTRFRSWLRPKVTIPYFNSSVRIPAFPIVIVATYLVIAFIAFQNSHVIFDVSYHLLAFVFSYAMVGIFRRKLGLT